MQTPSDPAAMSVTIGLVQYSSSPPLFLPYSVGLLQASLQRAQDPRRYRFLLPRVLIAPLAGEVEALRTADVAAFSIFVWNEQRSLPWRGCSSRFTLRS
ncbi:MAG TPA: hypothetical protein V6D23_18975 [Candidatus Obscuribacterales bacterium]